MAVVAILITIPVVFLIPRVRTSPVFDRLLWVATMVVGFLAAWVAVAMAKDSHIWDTVFVIADTPVLPTIAGVLIGVLALNLPLWLLDRFDSSSYADEEEEQELDEETELALEPEPGAPMIAPAGNQKDDGA